MHWCIYFLRLVLGLGQYIHGIMTRSICPIDDKFQWRPIENLSNTYFDMAFLFIHTLRDPDTSIYSSIYLSRSIGLLNAHAH